MAQVYQGFASFGLFAAGYQVAAGLCAALAAAARRRSARLRLTDDLRTYRLSRHSIAGPLPGSLFDGRYRGLTAEAAHLDAAICRRQRLL
jgi:hypothetical protein